MPPYRFLLLFTALTSCSQLLPAQPSQVLNFFRLMPLGDTLHVEISDESPLGDSIPNRIFFREIPADLLNEIDYLADSSSALVTGKGRFPINDSLTACWVDIRQAWFQHHSLLIYNNRQKAFTARITLAEWFGGDGSQVLTGSWLFDYDGDGIKDIIRREIQHSMHLVPETEDVEERIEESATLLLWREYRFCETPVKDTAALVKRFPIVTPW